MYTLTELGYVLICQFEEKEKYVVLIMLLQKRAKAQQEIKMDKNIGSSVSIVNFEQF